MYDDFGAVLAYPMVRCYDDDDYYYYHHYHFY
jgi:hypothetical protein